MDSLKEYYPFLFVLIGLIVLLYALLKNSAKEQLKQTGIKTEGIVFKQEKDPQFRNNNNVLIKDLITIRFVTVDQQWITRPINQDFRTFYSNQYKDGDPVIVYYDRDNPENFYVDTKQSEIMGRLGFAIAGLIILGIGIYQLITVYAT